MSGCRWPWRLPKLVTASSRSTPISARSRRSTAATPYIEDISSERLLAARIDATTRYAKLAKADAVISCVPTPLTRNREPDLGPLLSAARGMRDGLQAGQLVVLESPTFPGTTRDHLVPILEESGLKVGLDFNAAFSPERVTPVGPTTRCAAPPQTHLAAAFLALAVVIGLTVAPCWPWASSSST
jgi:UDP-N-acetyl-D-mannosaminuronate dehydrogenase